MVTRSGDSLNYPFNGIEVSQLEAATVVVVNTASLAMPPGLGSEVTEGWHWDRLRPYRGAMLENTSHITDIPAAIVVTVTQRRWSCLQAWGQGSQMGGN